MKALPALLALLLALTSVAGGAVQGAIPADPADRMDAPAPGSPSGDSSGDGSPTSLSTAGSTTGGASAAAAVNDSLDNDTAVRNRTVHVLDIPDDELARSTIDRQTLDLGPAMDFSTDETTWRLRTATMTERIRSAEDTTRRQRLLLGALNNIEQQTITLRARQQDAIAAYSDEKIDAKRLLVRLAGINAEAKALEQRRNRIIELAKNTEEFSLDAGRLAALQRSLDTFTGPVRAHAQGVLSGREQPTRFYVAAGDQSVVLTTITNGTYVREAFRGTLRQRNDPRISDVQEAIDVTTNSYPVIMAMRNNSDAIGSGNSFLVTVPHREGHLSAFVDSGSKKVFKEFQSRPLRTMEGGEPVSEVKDGLRLRVNQTYPGAPMRVHLTDAQTGVPVDANITVGLEGGDSDFVGATGADGSLWTLTPRGRITVTAIKGNSVVFVTMQPAQIPYINASAPSKNQSIVGPVAPSDGRDPTVSASRSGSADGVDALAGTTRGS